MGSLPQIESQQILSATVTSVKQAVCPINMGQGNSLLGMIISGLSGQKIERKSLNMGISACACRRA